MRFREELDCAATASGVVLEERLLDACAAHFEVLLTWNRTHNLTRITDPGDAARKHYLDCLVPLLALKAPASFVDVGSGAGFPGLLAALVWPGARAVLVEPAGKRASFLHLASRAIGVRADVISPDMSDDAAEIVMSRATFSAGGRAPLVRYALPDGRIGVWGHSRDFSEWNSEVGTWCGWGADIQNYSVEGLEPRAVLWAMRGVFHVEHNKTPSFH
jgi:16S rRNA (guanine527-N7)-methyltransferase